MCQTEVPCQEWATFCSQFTRQHQSWIINLSIAEADIGLITETGAEEVEQIEKRMRPLSRSTLLHSVAVEPHYGNLTIAIMLGTPPGQVAHWIDDPVRLFFRQSKEGAHEGLLIQSGSGQIFLLRFRVAAAPETVDGIADAQCTLSGCGTT